MLYIRQFDSVRAFAVLLVIFAHWLPELDTILPLGTIGVDIFFVLSGFLITRILLNKKKEIDLNIISESRLSAIKNFIVRRSLRIFPIYYLVILLLYLFVNFLPNPVPNDIVYYISYTQNIITFLRGEHPGGKVGHLWSLAVEEQFYFIWPWLIFFISFSRIKSFLIFCILLGCSLAAVLPFIFTENAVISVLMPTNLQALCFGGLLSYYHLYNIDYIENNYNKLTVVAITSFILYIYFKILMPNVYHFDLLLISIFTIWILYSILSNRFKLLHPILNNKQLIFIGKISYGIYIYHTFIPVVLKAIIHYSLNRLAQSSFLYVFLNHIQSDMFSTFIVSFLILILVSHLSFKYIELPFLKIKNKFI